METALTALFCMACFLLGAIVSGGLALPEAKEQQHYPAPDDPLSEEIGLLLGYNPCNSNKGEVDERD